ncbi:MAG: SIR2 family protein [Planctomycetes bacterium]|nr:SIR2 family protein [Planctomycetota bacterium]
MLNTLKERDWELLLERIKDGKCTPFIGAGACFGTLPLGSDIARKWSQKYNYPLEDSGDLARVSQYLAVLYDPMFPKGKILQQFKSITSPDFTMPDEPHSIMADLPLPVYITTNYDDFMVKALRSRNKDPKMELCRWNKFLQRQLPPSILESGPDPTPANPVVFHLHGHKEVPESLVLTEDDYLDFLKNISEDPELIPARIQRALSGASLLFLGYRIADWDFRVLFRSLVTYLERSISHAHVSVQLLPLGDVVPGEQREKAQEYLDHYFEELKIRVYWGTVHEFCFELKKKLEAFKSGD